MFLCLRRAYAGNFVNVCIPILEYALHNNISERRQRFVPLVSSPERSAAVVLVISRLLIDHHLSRFGLYRMYHVRVRFPDMPCIKGVYRDRNGVGPLVSSQDRRAAAVPGVNQLSTARHVPRFGLHRISFVRAPEEISSRLVFGALECKMDGSLLGAPARRRPIPPCPALPRPAPLRCPAPPVVCPGFGLDRVT